MAASWKIVRQQTANSCPPSMDLPRQKADAQNIHGNNRIVLQGPEA
jgi:hypothetical protein